MAENYVRRRLQALQTYRAGWGGEQASSRGGSATTKHHALTLHVSSYGAALQLASTMVVEDEDPHQPPEGAVMAENYARRRLQALQTCRAGWGASRRPAEEAAIPKSAILFFKVRASTILFLSS